MVWYSVNQFECRGPAERGMPALIGDASQGCTENSPSGLLAVSLRGALVIRADTGVRPYRAPRTGLPIVGRFSRCPSIQDMDNGQGSCTGRRALRVLPGLRGTSRVSLDCPSLTGETPVPPRRVPRRTRGGRRYQSRNGCHKCDTVLTP
jgi:hypothetical protein